MANVVCENLTKVFKTKKRQVTALDNLNLEVHDKEFLVMLGPSGCGKTTALRTIAGLETPTSGSIYIDNKQVTKLRPRERGTAMVFQDYALYPHMTVYGNLSFGLENFKLSKKDIKIKVTDTCKLLGIDDVLNSKPGELSGGQRQRVALGRTIVRSPKVFLFDEPLSNIDAKLRVQMRMELAKLKERLGITIIYVTHDQIEAMTLGERLVVMRNGGVQQIDTPQNTFHRPRNMFVAGFIGQMNFLKGRLNRIGDSLHFVSDDISLKISDRRDFSEYSGHDTVLGIRPEDIHVYDTDKSTGTDKGSVIQRKLETVEMLGNETCLYFTISDKTLVAKTQSELSVHTNDIVPLFWNMEKVHMFDPEAGDALQPRERE